MVVALNPNFSLGEKPQFKTLKTLDIKHGEIALRAQKHNQMVQLASELHQEYESMNNMS